MLDFIGSVFFFSLITIGLMIVLGFGAALFGWYREWSKSPEQKKAEAEAEAEDAARFEEEEAARMREYVRDLSLTCHKCNALAKPIPETGNRYRCDKCGNQFAAALHNFTDDEFI